MKLLFVLLLSFTLAYGHNWMQAPLAYNGNKAKAGNLPCNAETATYAEMTPASGEIIPVKWTTNHGGMHYVKVVASADIELLEDLAKDDATILDYFESDKTVPSTTITVDPLKYTAGSTYVLQYSWGNYRNCARFTVSALVAPTIPPVDPSAPTVPGSTVDPNVGPDDTDNVGQGDCNTYCADFQRQCERTLWHFSDATECLDACALYPINGADRTKKGNTFQCRWYHLHPDPDHNPDGEVHCSHASKDSTEETCQGGNFIAAANVLIKLELQTTVTTATLQAYIDDCLTQSGYTDVTVQEPTQGNNGYTVQLIFMDTNSGGETLEAKLKAVKVDPRVSVCMETKPGVNSFDVASTDFSEPGKATMESPTMVLSFIAILLCLFFQ